MRKRIRAHWDLVEKPGKKISFGRPRRLWENNIQLNLQEIFWKVSIWLIRINYEEVLGCCERDDDTSFYIKLGGGGFF